MTPTEVSVDALYNVLTYLLEGMYLKDRKPESYHPFITLFQDRIYDKFSSGEREKFRRNLSDGLKHCLNGPDVNCGEIFYRAAMHGLDTEEETRELFGLIWAVYFGAEDWHDERDRAPGARLVNGLGEPFP